MFYGANVLNPGRYNDNGSVHTNNSLLSHIAYGLYKSGMTLAEESKLWFTSIELITPLSDYDDVYACLLFSARINGLEQYADTITRLFTEAGLLGDPAGQYMLVYGHPTQEGVAYYGYHSTGWAAGTDGLAYVEVTAGQTTRLNDIR